MEPTRRNHQATANHKDTENENKKLRRNLSKSSLDKIEGQILDLMDSLAELRTMEMKELKKQKKVK